MSDKDAGNALDKKLLGIIEEELSSLKLHDEEKKVNEFLNCNPAEGKGHEITDKEDALSDNTENTLIKSNSIEKEEHEVTALNSPDENKAEDVQIPINNEHQEMERIPQEESCVPISEQLVTKYLQQTCNCRKEEIYSDSMKSFVPPSDSLAEKILRRVELYFEDYNIFKNSFLLNHVRRSKKGYISLKLVASLRKVKTLTKDFRAVAYSIRKSKVLEFSSDGNKIRRIEPLPKIEDTKFGKTLMIFHLPQVKPSVDYLVELFSKFGIVVSAGIFGSNPNDSDPYHERCLHFHRKIASGIYGIVEFERYSQVVNALKDEEGHLPKENQMKVVPLLPQVYKKEKKHLKILEEYHSYPRRQYGRYPRDDSRILQNEVPVPNYDKGRKMNMNPKGNGYQYRSNYHRSYKGRRNYEIPNTKNFWEGQVSNGYNGLQNKKWDESRQLKTNNSYNTNHAYPNMNRKRACNGFNDNGIPE